MGQWEFTGELASPLTLFENRLGGKILPVD
jgi:hypothetical protein